MPMLASVCGTVVRAGGTEPVPRIRILCVESEELGGRTAAAGAIAIATPTRPYSGRASRHASVLSDEMGRFLMEVPPGRWAFQAEGGRGQIVGEAVIHVHADALSAVTIEVGASPAPRSAPRPRRRERTMTGGVRGLVIRNASGEPVENAAIVVMHGPASVPDISPLTDADGRFVLDYLPPGEWVLAARGPESETGEATVRISADERAEVTIRVG